MHTQYGTTVYVFEIGMKTNIIHSVVRCKKLLYVFHIAAVISDLRLV